MICLYTIYVASYVHVSYLAIYVAIRIRGYTLTNVSVNYGYTDFLNRAYIAIYVYL